MPRSTPRNISFAEQRRNPVVVRITVISICTFSRADREERARTRDNQNLTGIGIEVSEKNINDDKSPRNLRDVRKSISMKGRRSLGKVMIFTLQKSRDYQIHLQLISIWIEKEMGPEKGS